nr:hypothetical protein CFP56_20255 [Quercus suber]
MAAAYFTLPSFARAKKNQQELEKQHPREPVLKDEDEKFLERHMSQDNSSNTISTADHHLSTIDSKSEEASEPDRALMAGDQGVVPETTPKSSDRASELQDDRFESADDPPEQILDASLYAAEKMKKTVKTNFELPSQEEAEAITQDSGVNVRNTDERTGSSDGKRTWASYIPTSMTGSFTKKDSSVGTQQSSQTTESGSQRTWTQYASSYVPSLPNILSNDKDANNEPVYREDGSIDEIATQAKQEQEVSVLLDKLNLSNINNRVFAFSEETQKVFDRFALVLKDTMNGGPRAYEDMEKLMREVGPQIEKQYKSMPPFIQMLVKSLPARLGTTLAPELLGVRNGKSGADSKAKQSVQVSSTEGTSNKSNLKKKRRRVPGLKSLIGKQGAVAGILRNVVSFLRVRFPLLASGTNVIMSLAVFILMFVFWYCHKRGKETRLAQQAEVDGPADDGDDGEDFESSGSDEEEG